MSLKDNVDDADLISSIDDVDMFYEIFRKEVEGGVIYYRDCTVISEEDDKFVAFHSTATFVPIAKDSIDEQNQSNGLQPTDQQIPPTS